MEFQKLQQRFPDLLEHMKASGYCDGYIRRIKGEMDWISRHVKGNRWQSYEDLYKQRVSETNSLSERRNRKTGLEIIARFDLLGLLPDRTRKESLVAPRSAYHHLNPEFKSVIDTYAESAEADGLKPSTIGGFSSYASCFLLAMQQRGRTRLDEITEDDTLSFFRDVDGTLMRGGSCSRSVSAVLRRAAKAIPQCDRVRLFLPMIRTVRKNVQRLTEDEVSALRHTLDDPISSLSLRDRAIGKLLMLTGMRSCDVASFRLDAIDWKRETIEIVQQKTEVPLTLPLPRAVGNAIFDYLKKERPRSDEPWVFLSQIPPHRRLQSSSIGNVAKKLYRAAGIRQKSGARRGTHLFRHHAVTVMLAAGTARPVISEVLGHASPISLDPYLGADIAHLRECALDVSRFPIAEEVFAPC